MQIFQRKMWISSLRQLFLQINIFRDLPARCRKNIGAENAVAFDINAACSGFLFALDNCGTVFEHGGYQHALVIGAETLSKNDGLDGPEHLRAFWGRRRGSSSFSK